MDNLKFRDSWARPRPSGGRHPGGQVLDPLVRVDGGTGSQGNPAPGRESTNIDLSLEWYYAEGSYASIGYFNKDIDNYVGVIRSSSSLSACIRRSRRSITKPWRRVRGWEHHLYPQPIFTTVLTLRA
jgi:outer membrane receptor protein involved in Fe transport